MKKIVLCLALTLSACANLTPQQQANLQLQLKVGETYLQVAQNLFCVFEPTAGKLVAIFNSSTNVRTAIAQADAAQAILCPAKTVSAV